MTYQQFKDKYYQEILPNKHEDIRKGQALMNFLGDIWFAEYKRMSSKFAPNVDCFYNDNLIPAALCHLQNNWHKFYDDIKKIYFTFYDELEQDENLDGHLTTFLSGERNVHAYYVNNGEIISLFDLNINIVDDLNLKIKEELKTMGFDENICLVKL